ncbi:MAG TPA: adenine deaminase [Bacteroidales bacterium]|nr:adenine deaminase [Bacteroidales bacterium]HQI46668.1 adenine deaminase [Bacteroidales bacterium]
MKHIPFSVSGNIVDVVSQRIYSGTIEIKNGKIHSILEKKVNETHYIIPGFIDAHIHIESSMLIPSEFARIAVTHGTVATVSDPHEIANVLGIEGVKFMIQNGEKVPFKFYFGAPSCVPATSFESTGASLGIKEIDELLSSNKIYYLAEMMNFPGVLANNEEIFKKIALAKKYGKPTDGHAPGVAGDDAIKYISAGISTDHECFSLTEAIHKIKNGMKILIREGSAAKNFEELIPLMDNYADDIMFCSDDKHPDELAQNHMNTIASRAVKKGYNPLKVLRTMSYNPVNHYKLNVGLLQPNDDADFLITDSLEDFHISATYIKGEKVAENGKTFIKSIAEETINVFNCKPISIKDLEIEATGNFLNVIEAINGQLITKRIMTPARIENGKVISDPENDILKIVVLNRYTPSKPSIGFIKNFGLKKGAIASTVAHDSHNIIAVGTNDYSILKAMQLLIEKKGGICVIEEKNEGEHNNSFFLPLQVGGIMSNENGYLVAEKYIHIDKKVKELGCKLTSPFMTLSFMALLVIPEIKISDKGLFDVKLFDFIPLFNK